MMRQETLNSRRALYGLTLLLRETLARANDGEGETEKKRETRATIQDYNERLR